MPKKHELTAVQKGSILALAAHFSHREIGNQLSIPHETVTDFIDRYRKRQSTENLPRLGRPKKTSDAADRLLVRVAEANTRIPFRELKNEVNLDVSERTLQRRLQKVAGIRKWRAVSRALLTKRHAKLRQKWAQAHLHWTIADWRKVIWSDESIVKRDSGSGTIWVFRRQTKYEKYAAKNIHGKRKFDNASVLMWGCFIDNKLGPLVFIDGTVKQDTYINLLDKHFIPFLEALHNDDDTALPLYFVQDNATPHVALKTQKYLNTVTEKYQLIIMDWPPNSPDMNIIEQLWAHLKHELYRRFPDTGRLTGSIEYIRATIRQRLHTIWWDIGMNVLMELVESMPRRVKALAHAEGWYTDF